MFYWNSKFCRYFDTLPLDFPLGRAIAESGRISLLLCPQKLVIFFRLAVRGFSTEACVMVRRS